MTLRAGLLVDTCLLDGPASPVSPDQAPWLPLPQGTPLHPEAWYLLLTKVASIKKGKRPQPRARPGRRAWVRPLSALGVWIIINTCCYLDTPLGTTGRGSPSGSWAQGLSLDPFPPPCPAPMGHLRKLPSSPAWLGSCGRRRQRADVWGGAWNGTARLALQLMQEACGWPPKTRGKAGSCDRVCSWAALGPGRRAGTQPTGEKASGGLALGRGRGARCPG